MKSWALGTDIGSLTYRLFDGLRARVNRHLVRFLSQIALVDQGNRVLEAGSGPAYASSLLARHMNVSMAVALDFDISALRVARYRDPRLSAVVGDLRALPFVDGAFDLVWNSSTIEHLDRPDAAVEQMRRVSGRYVFIGVPYHGGPLGFEPWIRRTTFGLWMGPVYKETQLAALMRDAGLQPMAVHLYFFRFFIGVMAKRA